MGDSAAVGGPVGLVEAQTALDFWQSFDLMAQKASLDSSCVDMRENKTNSITGRKRLNEQTKAFRAKPKEEQVTCMVELLKSYQEEIDQLSRRCKYCETTFFALYKALYEAPDPAETINGLIEIINVGSSNQLEIERLEGEIRQYEDEFKQLKNQDITIRRLEDQLQEFKDQNEEKIVEEVNKRIAEIEAAAEGRIQEAVEMQSSAERRRAEAIDAMHLAEQSADRAQTQLYEVSLQAEKRVSALQSENAVLAEGTQRLNMKIAQLETELEHAISNGSNTEGGSNSDTQEDMETLQLVVTKLRDELSQQEDALRAEKQRTEAASREHVQMLSKERDAIQQMKQELATRPSREQYAALKKQLKVVQKIAFNVADEDLEDDAEGEPETSPGESGEPSSIGGQLEALLTARLKALESEMSELRRDLASSKEQERCSREEVASLTEKLSASTQLTARMEADLEARSAALEESVLSAAGTSKSTAGADASSAVGRANDEGVELAQLLGVTGTSTTAEGGNQSAESGAAPASNGNINMQMIHILQSQRDNYKERLTRAETSMQKLQHEVDTALNAKEQLEADNIALYSKIRFMQSYQATAGGSQLTPHRGFTSTREEGRVNDEDYLWDRAGSAATPLDIESRYNSLYEQRMNPFEQFSQHEKQRKMRELPVADRIVLNTTMALVSNANGRRFLIVYLGLMHLLVFGIIYYSTHHVHVGCDPSLDNMSPAATAAIAARVAPNSSPEVAAAVAGTVLHHR